MNALKYETGETIDSGDIVEYNCYGKRGKAKVKKVGGLVVNIFENDKDYHIIPSFLTLVEKTDQISTI